MIKRMTIALALLLVAPVFVEAQESITITANGVSFRMIKVQGGSFTMGATTEQGSDVWDDERPAHKVTLSSYYIGETEVTQQLWKAVMGDNPAYFRPKEANAAQGSFDAFVADAIRLNAVKPGTVKIPTRQEWDAAMLTTSGSQKRPVEQVSWEDCQAFIRKLNQITGKNFRLPTEAEWEFAARGGTKSRGYKYSGSNSLGDIAWYETNAEHVGSKSPNYGTHDVKTRQANELGLYDMSGNVWEWCQDWYDQYGSGDLSNPKGPASGSRRVLRGGGWCDGAESCRVSYRVNFAPSDRRDVLGLRLAL